MHRAVCRGAIRRAMHCAHPMRGPVCTQPQQWLAVLVDMSPRGRPFSNSIATPAPHQRSASIATPPPPASTTSDDEESMPTKKQKQKQKKAAKKGSAKEKARAAKWNVHREITMKGTPLTEVFQRLQHEVDTREMRSQHVRQAMDVFYFHCVQQVASLPPQFLDDVLAFFYTVTQTPSDSSASESVASPSSASVVGKTVNEGVFSAVVKLHLSRGDVEDAWAVARLLIDAMRGKVHFRTVGPIIDLECRTDRFTDALSHWRFLKELDMEWTTTMEDTLIQLVIACQRHHHGSSYHPDAVASKSSSPSLSNEGKFLTDMQELLHDLRLSAKAISPENVSRLRDTFTATGYTASELRSDSLVTPVCECCHTQLQKQHPTEDERQKLVRAIESSAPLKAKNMTMTTREFLGPFKRWILGKHDKARREGKLHYILDGPNIAYLNQNFDAGSFRFDHVDRVAQMLQRDGHEVSITIPFTYLEETSRLYIRSRNMKQLRRDGRATTRKQTPEEKAMIERWKNQQMLFSCRTDILSDDIFWLYASALLGHEARVVTNDQGRDHVFALLGNRTTGMTTTDLHDEQRISIDLLERWRASTIVNIEIQHKELTARQKLEMARTPGRPLFIPVQSIDLLHPPPFSRVPQISADGAHLHFPIASLSSSSSAISPSSPSLHNPRWLCLTPSTDAFHKNHRQHQ